jgi:predicted transposase/invertase (TIGR01784 family)
MKKLLETLAEAADRGEREGLFTATDKQVVIEHLERLFQELYMEYTEFKETNMILQDRILTYSEEVAKQEREKARKEKLQIARNLKQMGLSDTQIASATGLSHEDIQQA